MPQPRLKQDYDVMAVSCGNCQQDQLVHVQARTGTWSAAHQSVGVPEMRPVFCGDASRRHYRRSISTASYLLATMRRRLGANTLSGQPFLSLHKASCSEKAQSTENQRYRSRLWRGLNFSKQSIPLIVIAGREI